jgi:hypothetical protein
MVCIGANSPRGLHHFLLPDAAGRALRGQFRRLRFVAMAILPGVRRDCGAFAAIRERPTEHPVLLPFDASRDQASAPWQAGGA